MFSGADAPWHWLIIAILVIALFGYKKLPDAARSMGRSLRIFKTEIKGMGEDDAARAAAKAEVVPPPQLTQPAPPPTEAAERPVETPIQASAPQPAESEPKTTG